MGSYAPPSAAAEPALTPLVFSTRGLPASAQFDAWREFMSPAIEMRRPERAEHGFAAEQTIWDLGRFAISRAVMPAGGSVRRWQHVHRNPFDHWCLVLVRDTTPADGQARSPGRLYLRSLGVAFNGQASDREVISLYFPRDPDSRLSACLERLPQDLGRSALLDLLADFLGSLEMRLATTRPEEVSSLVHATETIVAACLMPSRADFSEAREIVPQRLVERARRVIRREIYSPALTPDYLAREIGVSRSGLYRMFEPLGGVRHAIQRERLHAAHRALSDPANQDAILTIAEQSGFADTSGFSRAFRKEFGCSPSDVRAASALGLVVAAVAPTLASGVGDLGSVLGRLRN